MENSEIAKIQIALYKELIEKNRNEINRLNDGDWICENILSRNDEWMKKGKLKLLDDQNNYYWSRISLLNNNL